MGVVTRGCGQRMVLLIGRINQSLMTLRNCMETLRENQRNGTNKVRPCVTMATIVIAVATTDPAPFSLDCAVQRLQADAVV